MQIVNLSTYFAMPAEAEAGLVDLPKEDQLRLRELCQFAQAPTRTELFTRAAEIAALAEKHVVFDENDNGYVLLGGLQTYLTAALVEALGDLGLDAVYRHSEPRLIQDPINPFGIHFLQTFTGFVGMS